MELLAQVGDLLLYPVTTLAAGRVGLLFQSLVLYLQLPDTSIECIDLAGSAVQLHTPATGCFIYQVNGLVRQETVGDIAM